MERKVLMIVNDDLPMSFFFYLVAGLIAMVALAVAILFYVALR